MRSTEQEQATKDAENGDPGGFRLHVSKDKMRVMVDCDLEGRDLQSLGEDIVAKLVAYGVYNPPAPQWVAAWLGEASGKSTVLKDAVVVQGMPPIPPVDGRIEWTDDFFNKGFVWDEKTDRVDFRQHAARRNVVADQLLATVLAPEPGENGYDVLGKTIRARKPRRRRIRAGANVRAEEGGSKFYSKIDGRIRWANGMLSVDNLYEITGSVGLETGHISHPGSVFVQRDVLEGARIEAVGDVEVLGVIESAHVQTGGALIVHGGITGADGSHIVAAGGVTARYILDADVRAGDDVVVEREIVQSVIRTRGAVYMPSGRIVGGSVSALEGVEAAQIGTKALVPTEVIAGEDYCLEGALEIIRRKRENTKENIARIHATLEPFRGKVAALPDDKKQAVRTLVEQLSRMEKSLVDIAEEEAAIRRDSSAQARHIILIRGKIFPEVRLRIKGALFRTREMYTGPVKPVCTEDGVEMTPTNIRSIRDVQENE